MIERAARVTHLLFGHVKEWSIWESAAGPAEFTTLGHASDSTLVLLVELSVDHYSPPSSS